MSGNDPTRAHTRLQPGEEAEVEFTLKVPPTVYPPRRNWSPLVWLRWNLKCKRGRECAELEIDESSFVPGMTIYAEYVCDGCGSRYLYSSKEGRKRQ